MNVSPFSCVSNKKLLFRLLFSRLQIARERKKRDLSLSLFFVCLLFRVSNFGRERERERGLLSPSLSPLRLFLLRRKKTKKKNKILAKNTEKGHV